MANYTFLAAQNYRTNRKKEDSKGSSSSDYRKDEENARLVRIEAIQRLRNGTTYNPTLLHTAEKMASDDTKEKFSNTKTTLDSVTTAKSAASTHSKKSPAITAGTTSNLMESAKSKSQPSAGASLSAITTAKSSAKKNTISRNDFSSVTPDDTLLEKANEPVTEKQATTRKAYSIYDGLDEETYKKANEAFKAADISGPSAAARQRTAVANALMESGISKEKAAQYAKNWGNVQGAKGIIDDARYESSVEKRVNELSDDQYKELGNYIVRTAPKYYFDHPDLLDDSKPYYGQWESVDEYKQKFMDTYGVSEDEFDIYVDAAKRKLNQEATEREEQKRQENMDKYPWATMAYNVEDLATGFIADGMAATTTAIAKLTGRQIDPYDYGFRQQRLNAAVEQKSAEQFADLVGKLGGGETAQNIAAGAYSVGDSIIKSKMAMDMGTGVADSLGLVKGTSQYRNIASLTNSGLFSASAFSNSVRESKDAGLSDEQALRTGVANGINESLMEYLSFDKVLGLLDKPGKVTIKEGVKRFMGAMFAEGSEELSTDLANTIADHLMNGEFEDTKNQVSYLVANGMDEETAKEQVWSDTLKQWTEDFIAGAISGGVFAGGRIASSNINYHNLADNVSVELKEQLAETSKTMEEGTTAREIAESKPVEEWTRDDTAKVLQSMEEIAGKKGNYEDILAHEIEKTGKGSEEAKTIAQDMVKAASTSSEDTTEEDSARRIETWDEGTQETYGKFLRGELTRENDTVASAYEVRESQRQEKQRGNSKTTVARAYEKSSNNPVIAVKISDITKSDAKVMLSDGSTTKLSEIRFDNRQIQQLYNLASTFESSNAANAFIEEFPGGDVATYARSVMAYYNAGRNGAKSFDSLMRDSQNGIYAAVDSSINRTFYELGVNDKTPVKAVTKPQADNVSRGKVIDQRTEVTPDSDFVTRVASVLSNADYENTVIKDTKLDNNARGEFNRILAEVAITTDSDNPLSAVVHEHIGEVSRAYNAEGWDKVVDEVMDYMYSKEGMQWVNNRVSTYKEAYKKVSSETDNRDAATEFVNDVIGEIFTTEEGLEHLMNHAQEKLTEKEQKSFIQSIKDFFNNMIKSLKDYMESHSRRFSRSEYLKASKQLEKIRDDALAAWDKAIENRKREMSGENSNTAKADKKAYSLNPNPDTKVEVDKEGIVIITGSRYSVSQVTKDFRNVAKNIRSELSKLVGNSYVIKVDNREVHIGADFVGEYSGSKDTQKSRKDVKRTKANAIPGIEKIIENADNPKYLQNDEEKHNNDARRGWTRYDVTFGLSDGSVVNYFRGFLNIRMAADGKDYVYDITKINKLKNGPHIRQATNNSAYDNSGIHKENISSNKENVNKRYSLNVDTEGNELSDQQQEYFKDSKIRDENGKLKPVYHGTKSQFNVFSYDFIGKTGSAEGYGFYFTDQIEKAKGYSKKGTDVMSGYLNITKPLSTSELTLTENEIRGLLSELDPTGDEILSNFEYTGEGYPSKQWYNKAMKETINALMENESDDDVLAEIVNSGSDNETVLTTVRNLYGYDGYIVEDKYGDGNVYVAFTSEQFKNADNRQPTSDKDIRYSLNLENEGKKYSTNIDEALFEALEETWTLEEQKQASGIVQQGFEALQSVEINDRIVNKIAKNILKQYSSDYSTEDLSYNIKNIFAYLKNTENVSFDDMTKVMQEVAKPVLEQSKRIDPRDKADYDDFINYLSQKRIKLTSAQRQEVEYTYGSYDDFRKSMFGKVTLSNKGVPLDDIWSEIVQQSGYRLSEDVSDADEITALAEVIEDMKPVPRNPFGMDMDDAAYDVALDIYRQFFIEQAAEKANEKVKKVIGQKTDQLIEKQQQYRRKYGQMYMEAVAKERRKTEELQKASIARLQGEFYKLDQAERDAIRESDLISQAVIKAEREKYEGRLRRLRNQKNDKIAEINARHANSRTKAAQQRRAAYLKEGIRKNMDSLNSMLMHPNENKHIPAGMVRSVIDVCEAVNVDTGKSRLMKEKLEKLQGFYESYRNDDQFSFDYDERIDKDIDTLKNMFAGRNYTELTNDELQRVYNIVNALKQQISNANKLIDNKLVKDAHEGAKQAVEEVTRAKRHANNVVTYNLDKFASYHLNAYREFRKLSGYKDNSVLMSIYDELERGQQKELEIQRHVNDAFLGLLQSNRKEAMRLESYKPDDLVDIGLKDENGKPVMVTRAMRLSVIMHSYNKGNMNHVLNEGLTIPDIKLYEKGKIKEAWEKAKTYRYVSYELMLDAIKSKDSERLTAEQAKYERSVRKLESDLSDFEKEFLKIAKEVFHNYFGKEINKVTMQTRGYAAARVENYYPIKTDPDFTHSNFGGLVMDSSLEGMGMLKERVRSKNPILLEDITKVVIRQANNTSKYVGYAIPIRNFNMLMNSTFHDSNGRIRNMKETVRNVWGNSNEKYLENIFKDIQGARKTESGIMDNLRSSFAGATLTLNVSVAMKQAASYPTAAAVVGYGPLLKAMKDIPKGFNLKKGIPELEKRNSLLWVRSQGYSNERIADTTQTSAMKSKAKEKLDWISFMDIGTVRTLEYASMYYVDSNFKNLKKGSDEYWDKVSETFTKVVAETQPNYTTLQQAAVTRDPNKFMKQIIMFKTQSLQNFGIVYDAVGNYNAKSIALKEAKKTNSAELIATAKKEKMQAAKNLANATTSQIVAAAVFNAMTILSKLMLHKWKPFQDDDGEWSSEKLMNFFMVGMVDTLSGSIIWGSEIADVLEALLLGETYYGTEVSVIEMWNDCNNAIINLHNNINKMNGAQTDEEYDKYNYKVQTSILTLVTTLGQFKGVPVNNVYNMFNAVYTYAAGTSIMNGDVEKQYDRIVDAYLDGDTKEYKRLYEQKANTLSNPDSAKSGTKSTIKERYLNGEMSQEQAESFLNDLGYDDAYFTIKEWDYTNETGEKYLQYGELDSAIEDAVKSGDRQSVIDAVKDLTDHGIKESSVESHISKTFKPIYQESHSKANLKSYLITAYEYCGVPRDKAMEKIKAWE